MQLGSCAAEDDKGQEATQQTAAMEKLKIGSDTDMEEEVNLYTLQLVRLTRIRPWLVGVSIGTVHIKGCS